MNRNNRLVVSLFVVGAILLFSGLVTFVASGHEGAAVQPRLQSTPVDPTPIVNTVPLPDTISGVVLGADDKPVADAIVQVQATQNKTTTGADGRFTLTGISGTTPIEVTAWATGHYIGWTTVNPSAPDWKGGDKLSISMRALPQSDNPKYEWYTFEGVDGSAACGLCHREYNEWKADQHSKSATNIRFLNMYLGTNVNGEIGTQTEYTYEGNPIPADPSKPYHGPGYRLDNPSRAGNCASCHTPMASTSSNTQNCAWSGCHTSLTVERANGQIERPVIPNDHMQGDAGEGISCEFCHKIANVIVDPNTKMPFANMPGILSLELLRPREAAQQVFFGTLTDVTRPDSYLPLLSESKFCAGCHFGVFGGVVGMNDVKDGVVIYNSYGEWLTSPYSDPKTGKTCQQCHMPTSTEKWFVLAEKGGLVRNDAELHNHTMPGALDEKLLQNSVTMKTDAQRVNNTIKVEVSITNDQAGHDVPTDVPIRSMILVVEALDANGKPLTLTEGSVNPDFSGDYSGVAGKTFAKVLKDQWTGESPTGAFWRPVTVVEDNRIAAMKTDTTSYTFAAPDNQAVTINVKLLYRRAFYKLMQEKGWNDPDILMEQATLDIQAN